MAAAGHDLPAEFRDVRPVERHAEDGAHRGLDHLGIVQFHGVGRSDDPVDAEPVRHPEDGAQVAGVADAVQGQEQPLRGPEGGGGGLPDDREDRRRGGQHRQPRHRLLADLVPAVDGHDLESRRQRLGNHLFTLDHEESGLVPELLLRKGADLPQFVLGNAHTLQSYILFLSINSGKVLIL